MLQLSDAAAERIRDGWRLFFGMLSDSEAEGYMPTIRRSDGRIEMMRQAKASPDDIERNREFFLLLEEACGGTLDVTDPRLCELIREAWGGGLAGPGVGSSWRRIINCCETLITNCCDPDLDYLDWRPDIAEWLQDAAGHDGQPEEPHDAA